MRPLLNLVQAIAKTWRATRITTTTHATTTPLVRLGQGQYARDFHGEETKSIKESFIHESDC